MDEQSLILEIHNHHTAACGTPPHVKGRSGQYTGYFENEYGEQVIFVFDRRSGTGQLYAGDAGWEKPFQVVNGQAQGLIMSPAELQWLRACWQAVTAFDKR
jgi:hypothetical protein